MSGRERVQLFVTETGTPRVLNGWLTSVELGVFSVELADPTATVQGLVVLNFPDSERERVMTRLQRAEDGVHQFLESERVAPDKRNYPRLFAGIKVLYRPEPGDNESWFETDEYMNFSVSGLAFEGTGTVADGERISLMIEFANETRRWAVSAKVIRCTLLSEGERQVLTSGESTCCSLAVAFTLLAPDFREALEALTLRMLDV
jgi:hypothetical protein